MSQVQQVKDATDIIQVIGERVKLQRSGSSYKGLCPFHSEKSPSFFVSDQLQRYRCFGCSETGDVLDFLQKTEGMTFAESLQQLADRAGITLKDHQRTPEDDLRERLLEILSLSKEYYHYLLTKHDVGKEARNYLKERKINQESIKLFGLGYAQSGWDGLIKYLHDKKKYALKDIEAAGLIVKGRGGRHYDRFRGRVMFPLKDHRGRVVGFSGRLLEKEAKEAKYINTPETLLYHKSKMLYGYKELFSAIRKQEAAIIVEGEFDVISSAQAHVNHITAIKGSALTQEQVKLLGRTVKKIILCLDADEAGVEATRRAIEVVGETDIELRVIDLSELEAGEKDVDELARHQPKLWRETAEKSLSVYEFLLRHSLKRHDPAAPEGKREIVKAVGPVFASIPHAVERDFYIKRLAEALKVKESVITQDLQRLANRAAAGKSRQKPAQEEDRPPEPSKQEKLEHYLLFLLWETDSFSEKLETLRELPLTGAGLSQLLEHFAKQSVSGKPDLKKLTVGLGEDLKDRLFAVIHAPEFLALKESIQPEKEWQQILAALKKETARKKIEELNQEISALEKKDPLSEAEDRRLAELLREVVELQRQLRSGQAGGSQEL